MNKFTKLISTCMLIRRENIDTDQIIPAKFLKTTEKAGLGKYLFYNWRFDKYDKKNKVQQFDSSNYRTNSILIVGDNFGCGSSREHAVWALMDFGFQAVVSSSFGDIFYNNSLKNGLLPIVLKEVELKKLFQILEKKPASKVTINLDNQKLTVGILFTASFPIDNCRKTCLLNGTDELGYILSQEIKINKFEMKHKIYITSF